MRLNFDIAESKKTPEWAKGIAQGIVSVCGTSSNDKRKDRKCYEYFNLQYKPSDFNYLRKIGPYELPAKVRFIPVARSKFQRLRSTQATRSFANFKVYSDDEQSVIRRIDAKLKKYLSTVEMKIRSRSLALQHATQQLQEQMQQLDQMLQQDPSNMPPEQRQQLEVLKQNQHRIKYEIDIQLAQINRADIITDKEIKDIDKYFRYEAADVIEQYGQSSLQYLIEKLGIRSKNVRAYTDRIATGKSLFEVHHRPGEKYPYFEKATSLSTYWSGDEDVEWIQNCRWAARKFDMSAFQMLTTWKRYINPQLKKKLESYINDYNPEDNDGFVATQDGRAIDSPEISQTLNYAGTRSHGSKETWIVYWRSAREVHIKKSPNPYLSGKYFTHYITEEEAATWTKNEAKNREKGEDLRVRYVDDLWWAVVVGRSTVLFADRHPVQLRDPDNYSVELPIIGRAFNSASEAPYSLVWATKDIQELYNIVHYHRELMLALAGVKGIVMDKAQIPEEMSSSEWLYMRKQGSSWIDSRLSRSGYNQFQTYDDTLPTSIQYLDGILENLDNMLFAITGVAREATGATVKTDQVGTYQMAIEQSGLVAQIEFHEHDEVLQKALNRLVNLCHIPWANGVTLSFPTEDHGFEALRIPANVLKGVRFNTFLRNSQFEEKNIRELKQIALNSHSRGLIDLANIAKLYKLNSLPKLEKEIIAMAKESQEIAQKSQSNLEAQKAEAKKQEIDLMKRWEQIIKAEENKIAEAKVQVDQQALALKEKELELNDKNKQTENQIKLMDIMTERETEQGMLQEQVRSSTVNEQLQAMQLKLNTLIQLTQNERSHVENMEKVRVDEKKADNMGSRENHANNN